MSDLLFEERLKRVARLREERASGQGVGWVDYAKGARSSWRLHARSRVPWKMLVLLLVLAWVLQGTVIAQMGEPNYWRQVLQLQQGGWPSYIVGCLLQPKPGTLMLAHLLGVVLP